MLGRLLTEEPKVELRQAIFPGLRVVLARAFSQVRSEVTVPLISAQACQLGETLIEFVDEIEAGGTGEQS